jgi:pSer/pThr/pTyr-binding forkhead associated (FHA) protein
VARFRLRYQSTDLEMPAGDFVVGRSSQCHLALDDALVSRKHAVFRVDERGVVVEDLGSRNGVVVNGHTIEESTRLDHLDRVIVGSQELLIVRVSETAAPRRAHRSRPTLAGKSVIPPNPDGATAFRSPTVLDRLAEKALRMGRFEEGERMLRRRLLRLLREAREGASIPRDKREQATDYAMAIAKGLQRREWVDFVFDLHAETGTLPDAERVEQLRELVQQIGYVAGSSLRAYLEVLERRRGGFGPAERFLLQRVEGLARIAGAS